MYYPKLNGLRALAVFAVMWSHWLKNYTFGIPFHTGVHLFFVISGFLITGILLDLRDSTTSGGLGRKLKVFYARRFVRIFPLYYLVCLLLFLVGLPAFSRSWEWHITYLSNFYFIQHQGWDGPISHFWTLAVEEQFYLLWPLLILVLGNTGVGRLIGVSILIGNASRLVGNLYLPDLPLWNISTTSCLDSLAWGALLAYGRTRSKGAVRRFLSFGPWIYPVLLGLYVVTRMVGVLDFLQITVLSVLYMFLVRDCCGEPSKNRCWSWLEGRLLCRFGIVSYGLYIFHNFSRFPLRILSSFWEGFEAGYVKIPLLFLITWAFAEVSWQFFEAPINRLKRRYPYQVPQ